MADSQANENTCVVCFKNVLYYSIGECDHPVCFECSTRMRVLCLQNECPICRKDLSRVVFTESIQPYKELRNRVFTDRLFERQFKIGFSSEEIKLAYEKLLENCCKICDKLPPFRTFSMLNDHMRKVHERYFCDLCVKHLKIFTSERRCYTRQELAHHRRKGDVDDTSHRGHPLCEFCEERFMDADELYRHMRKEHLYCHLCDADGSNLYYASHSALAHHFRTDHYLCEEGECAGQHLTAVFRSEIDLKAHKATVHGRGMNRGAARQARTLELQFNITPHPVVTQRTPREQRERAPEPQSPVQAAPPPDIDTRNDAQFPALSAAPPAPGLVLAPHHRAYKGAVGGLARTDKNFPTLGGASAPRTVVRPAAPSNAPVAATIVRNSKPSVSIQLHSQPASASNFRLTQTSGNRGITIPPQHKKPPLSDDDFPSLGLARDDHPSIGASTLQAPKVTLINSQEMKALKTNHTNSQPKKAPLSSEAFPALSSTSAPVAPPQWITVKSKEKQRPAKPEPPPQPREPTFNPVADFPTLPINHSKSKPKKVQQQQQQQQAPPPPPQNNNDNTKLSKKEKKKQNSKKENFDEMMFHVNGTNDKKLLRESYAAVNNSAPTGEGKKIKTIETAASGADSADKNKNGGGNGDFNLAAQDYPPLNSKSENCLPTKKLANGSVPPGFKPRAAPACDTMTFTNSSGQTFPAPLHTYIPPPDFELRNRALVQKFAAALGGAPAVEQFKAASRAFRDSSSGADEFLQHCRAALGAQFERVLPELVALLPDIANCTAAVCSAATAKQSRTFPEDFLFGTGTASYQVEGGWDADDKGENIWDYMTHNYPDAISDRSNGDIACDSYNSYKRDVEIMRELGLNTYRFSLSWSRILPTGVPNNISQAGIQYYNNLIDEMLKYNIEPLITLYHWDLPQTLQERGGFLNPLIAEWFEDFARVAFESFGDRVKYWLTFNEAYQICYEGYASVTKAPRLNAHGVGEYLCAKNLLLAHARAYHAYNNDFRPTQGGIIGFTIAVDSVSPLTDSEEDKQAVELYCQSAWAIYTDPIFKPEGGFPKEILQLVAEKSAKQGYPRSRLTDFTDEEREFVRGTGDFFGVNHYTGALVSFSLWQPGNEPVPSTRDDIEVGTYAPDDWLQSASPWFRRMPNSLYIVLRLVHDRYGTRVPIIVTENGWSSREGIVDEDRIDYHREALEGLLDALEEGVNLQGYYAWSLMDNFEWMAGYEERFGLYEVDFEDPARTRTPRKSAFIYKQIVKTRQVDRSYEPDSLTMTIDEGH